MARPGGQRKLTWRLVAWYISAFSPLAGFTFFGFLCCGLYMLSVPIMNPGIHTDVPTYQGNAESFGSLSHSGKNSPQGIDRKGIKIRNFDMQINNDISDDIRKLYAYIMDKSLSVRPRDDSYIINVTASDALPLDRTLPDPRSLSCTTKRYKPYLLPSASVIIPFHNEALSVLLRNVHSIVSRSPPHLLHEVILVDDFSSYKDLFDLLDEFISELSLVRIIRNSKREGLIRTRMKGARAASGDVIIFLDAHTEVNVGWLEPLLHELTRQPSSVVQPLVDSIESESLDYYPQEVIHKGTFNWNLKYVWMKLPRDQEEEVTRTGHSFSNPVLVGCAFAAYRNYFFSIGGLFEGLEVWGGENHELSFLSWMCGGGIRTVPCSRVGHVFKSFAFQFLEDASDTIQKNLMMVADVWMDNYKNYFYACSKPFGFRNLTYSSKQLTAVKNRMVLKDKLKCHNFDWYITNIAPDVPTPSNDVTMFGEIYNFYLSGCFHVLPDDVIGVSEECFSHKLNPQDYFTLTPKGRLKHRDKCITANDYILIVRDCPVGDLETFGRWTYVGTPDAFRLVFDLKGNRRCVMQATSSSPYEGQQMPQLVPCDTKEPFQQWSITHVCDFT